MTQASSLLLLDLMGTLVREPFYQDVPAFFGMSLQDLLAVKDPNSWIEFENGRIDEATFLKHFFSDERSFDHQGMIEMMRSSYEYLEGADHLLSDLASAGVRLSVLSNYPSWHQMIDQKLGFSRFLESSFFSCDLGCRKPDAGAYDAVIASIDVAPEQILFVDDRPENCAGAERAGMRALHFTDVPALRAELTRREILRTGASAS